MNITSSRLASAGIASRAAMPPGQLAHALAAGKHDLTHAKNGETSAAVFVTLRG